MEQPFQNVSPSAAANMPYVELEPGTRDDAPLRSIWLRLVRGASLQPVWMLPDAAEQGGASVGAADACDWRIQASGMPDAAFSLQTLAGCLFVRASGDAEVRVDGHGLGSIWAPVESGARIAVGEALIEVGLSGRSRNAQSTWLQRAFHAADLGDAWRQPRCNRVVAPALAEQPEVREPLREDTHPVCPEQGSAWSEQVSAWSAPVQAEQLWSATIFGAEELSDVAPSAAEERDDLPVRSWRGTSLWLAGSLVACAYGCWVLLLDHF
jgi:predicted component of type VI protein secretion system